MDFRPMMEEARIESGFAALRDGGWSAARATFEDVLEDADIAEAHFGLGEALWWIGDMQGMFDHYERAYSGFRRRSDPPHAAGVALMLSFHSKIHLANHAAAEGWFKRAARLILEHDLVDLQGDLALFEGCLQDEASQIEACARRALEHARGSGDLDLELCALSLLGKAIIEQGRVEEGMPLLDEAMAASLGGEPERLDTVVFTCCNMMVSCTKCASFERAAEWVRASRRFSDRYGCPFLFAECRLIYGTILYQTGRWDEAEHELMAAMELSRDSVPAFFADATASLASLRMSQGRVEEAERLLDPIEGFHAAVPVAARLQLLHGRPELAAAMAVRRLDAVSGLQLDRVVLVEIAGESDLALGDARQAAERGKRLSEDGLQAGCRLAVACGERLLGRALAGQDLQAARKHLDRALGEFKHLDMPFEAGRTCLALAETLAAHQSVMAVSEARVALDTFERLGAERCADEALALLRRLGIRISRSGPRTEGDISPREEEVLALLGEGLSNPEIADRLFISRKTVEHHVSNILAKLELRNRAEAAAEAVRRGSSTSGPE